MATVVSHASGVTCRIPNKSSQFESKVPAVHSGTDQSSQLWSQPPSWDIPSQPGALDRRLDMLRRLSDSRTDQLGTVRVTNHFSRYSECGERRVV